FGVCYRPSAAGSSVQEIEALFGFLSHAFFRTVGPLPSRNRKSFLRRARSSRRASMTDDLHRDPGYLGQHSGTLSEPPSLRRSSARHPSALCLAPDHRRSSTEPSYPHILRSPFLHTPRLSTLSTYLHGRLAHRPGDDKLGARQRIPVAMHDRLTHREHSAGHSLRRCGS